MGRGAAIPISSNRTARLVFQANPRYNRTELGIDSFRTETTEVNSLSVSPARRTVCFQAIALPSLLPAFLLLAACSTLPGDPTPVSSLAARPVAANFTAAGRVTARVTGDARRAFSGGFAWTHRPGVSRAPSTLAER